VCESDVCKLAGGGYTQANASVNVGVCSVSETECKCSGES
jgi:hypothetical protein